MQPPAAASDGQPSRGKMDPLPFKSEEISILRSSLLGERIQEWLDDGKLVPLVIGGHDLHDRLAFIADSLLKALSTVPACDPLQITESTRSSTRRIRAHFEEPDIVAVRNYKQPGRSNPEPQLLVLPRETEQTGASISWALRLVDKWHKPSAVVSYKPAAKRVKIERASEVRMCGAGNCSAFAIVLNKVVLHQA
jgi:hypothetical protein